MKSMSVFDKAGAYTVQLSGLEVSRPCASICLRFVSLFASLTFIGGSAPTARSIEQNLSALRIALMNSSCVEKWKSFCSSSRVSSAFASRSLMN